MKENPFYVYNNEALVMAVIQKVLKVNNQMNIGRLFILTSFILYDKVVFDPIIKDYVYLKDYLNKQAKIIAPFPKIHIELQPIILNALTLMMENESIKISDCDIIFIKGDEVGSYQCNRLDNIEEAIPHVFQLTNQLTNRQLYDYLNIQL